MDTGKKLYIVDDEAGIRNSLERELRRWRMENGLESIQFDSPEAALLALQLEHGEVRVIISDQRMPGMDGIEFLRRVSEQYPRIGTLLLTGNIDIQDIADQIPAGVHGVLEKPWTREQLMAQVQSAFHKAESRACREAAS